MKNKKGFVPPMLWDLECYKKKDWYFYLIEVSKLIPNSAHVYVQNHGEMIMFGGYSYLGLIGHPEINAAVQNIIDLYGTGTHGVRLLAGTLPIHYQLESTIADFKKTEACITYSSGYVANLSTISSLVSRGDTVICDKLNHASIIDGCCLSQANFVRFKHNDMAHLEFRLKEANQSCKKLVVVDAVFSMDGDITKLPEIDRLCNKYDATLMVDEAHSIGVIGETGNGIEEHFSMPYDTIDVKMGTLSKTIPSVGGYIAGNSHLIDYLKHTSRGFIYSAALPPTSAMAALKAFEIIEKEPERIKKLQDNYTYFIKLLNHNEFEIFESKTAIVPIQCGSIENALLLSKHFRENGIFVQAVVPPIVPNGTARLRATVTANHTKDDIEYFIETLKEGVNKLGMNNMKTIKSALHYAEV